MICPMTGNPHQLFWMQSAWWCEDCRQKIESCCEGGGCPSVAEVLIEQAADDPQPRHAQTIIR
jgi:Na+-translocating ferredoxin:NAD+ oxidoreductase RnfC subunit